MRSPGSHHIVFCLSSDSNILKIIIYLGLVAVNNQKLKIVSKVNHVQLVKNYMLTYKKKMGIRGLMSYVTKKKETFSKKIELHSTKLVIDGNCIACQLYQLNKCNYCFGGDYGEYAYYVSEFFEELLKCNITPLVVFDGGLEDKKLNTILTRSQNNLLLVSYSTPSNEQKLIPALAKDVFKYIVQQKRIKMVQSSFEADDHIAAIARILKCPVLSNDSDFFIFDVMFIPVDSLEIGIFKNSNGQGFVKHCRVYTHNDFVSNFPGLNKKNLPLAAALLGNDYIDSDIFENFFSFLNISSVDKKHQQIEKTFQWLQNHSLDQAVKIILKKIDSTKREKILEIIEMIINGYLVPSSEMLLPLGYTLNEINDLTKAIDCEPYKFDQKETRKFSSDNQSTSELPYTSSDSDMISKLSLNDNDILKPNVKSEVKESIPSWFLYEYNASNFPAYFMDIIHRQLLVIPEHMEDQKHPACIFISLKIISVIFKLLNNGTSNSKTLQYIARGKGANVTTYELECNDDFSKDQEFPTLEKLTQLSPLKRKQILITTLEVPDTLIIGFPPTWRLYVAVIKYWSDKADKNFVTKWHLYSLILLITYHVVKKVAQLGSYFGKNVTTSNKNQADENKVQGLLIFDMPVKDALEKVQKSDCLKAMEFFKSYMSKDEANFNIEIIHAFSLLQISLRYSMHLNALLGYPYPNLNIAEFFHGTMAYNFYKDLKKHDQLNQRIRAIFANSPSVLQLFISISTKIQALFAK